MLVDVGAAVSALRVVPVTIGEARRFVEAHHSHHHAPVGGLFAGAVAEDNRVCCVAIVGRPVARMLDAQGSVAEVTRLASDGTRHAASMCLAAVTRAALALGWRRLVSYTILGESGASYLAAGWRITGLSGGGDGWLSRDRAPSMQPGAKVRWETGPDAAPADGAAALACAFGVGLAVPARAEALPLLRAVPP